MLVTLMLVIVSAERQRRQRRDEERELTQEEVLEIVDDTTIPDDNEEEIARRELNDEWDQHMSDFVPEDMLSVELEAGKEVSLHEDSPDENIMMRGAYFTTSPPGTAKEDKLIDFFVLDPNY